MRAGRDVRWVRGGKISCSASMVKNPDIRNKLVSSVALQGGLNLQVQSRSTELATPFAGNRPRSAAPKMARHRGRTHLEARGRASRQFRNFRTIREVFLTESGIRAQAPPAGSSHHVAVGFFVVGGRGRSCDYAAMAAAGGPRGRGAGSELPQRASCFSKWPKDGADGGFFDAGHDDPAPHRRSERRWSRRCQTRARRCAPTIARRFSSGLRGLSLALTSTSAASVAGRLPRPDGVSCARRAAFGANTPWNRVRCARGGGTSAASSDKVHRIAFDMGGAISPRGLSAGSTLPAANRQPVSHFDRRARDVPARFFQLVAFCVSFGGNAGMQGEAPPTWPHRLSSGPASPPAVRVCRVTTLRPACAPVAMR